MNEKCFHTGKICYRTRGDAMAHAVRIKRVRGHKGLTAYFCESCKWFHLGRDKMR